MKHSKMETYDVSMPDDSVHKPCCIKTEAGSNSNIADVSDHELHCIKTEHADVYPPTKTNEATMGCSNISNMDIKHELCFIKTEDGIATNIADADAHEFPCIKPEPANNAELSEHAFHSIKKESPPDV
jgi:hypothetical protein